MDLVFRAVRPLRCYTTRTLYRGIAISAAIPPPGESGDILLQGIKRMKHNHHLPHLVAPERLVAGFAFRVWCCRYRACTVIPYLL